MKRLFLILCLTLASPALADRAGDNGGGASGESGSDHDQARSALERHEILPLKRVLAEVRKTYGGRVIEVELEQRDGRYFYELKLILADGRILELEVDATDGMATGKGQGKEDD